jgi:hypothetical protein
VRQIANRGGTWKARREAGKLNWRHERCFKGIYRRACPIRDSSRCVRRLVAGAAMSTNTFCRVLGFLRGQGDSWAAGRARRSDPGIARRGLLRTTPAPGSSQLHCNGYSCGCGGLLVDGPVVISPHGMRPSHDTYFGTVALT